MAKEDAIRAKIAAENEIQRFRQLLLEKTHSQSDRTST